MFYMEHNEAQSTTADIGTVAYCASLLQVNPASLLRFVMEARS